MVWFNQVGDLLVSPGWWFAINHSLFITARGCVCVRVAVSLCECACVAFGSESRLRNTLKQQGVVGMAIQLFT